MTRVLDLIDRISLATFAIVAATLGLAPFLPEPHVWQKIRMLADGTLTQPIDIFDLAFHGLPWVLLFLKLLRMATRRG